MNRLGFFKDQETFLKNKINVIAFLIGMSFLTHAWAATQCAIGETWDSSADHCISTSSNVTPTSNSAINRNDFRGETDFDSRTVASTHGDQTSFSQMRKDRNDSKRVLETSRSSSSAGSAVTLNTLTNEPTASSAQ